MASERERLDHFCAAVSECLGEVWRQLGFEGHPEFFVLLAYRPWDRPDEALVRVFGTIEQARLPAALRETAVEIESGRGREIEFLVEPEGVH